MKSFIGFLILGFAVTSFAGEKYNCKTSTDQVYGNFTLVLEQEVPVSNADNTPTKVGTVDIYLESSKTNEVLEARCLANPTDKDMIMCWGMKEDVAVVTLQLHRKELVAMVGRVEYTCNDLN